MERGIQCRYALSACQVGPLTLEPASESTRAVTGWTTPYSMKGRVGSLACDESQKAVRDVLGEGELWRCGVEISKLFMVMVELPYGMVTGARKR